MVHLEVLSVEQVEVIHLGTLRILEEVGVVLTHPQGREILVSAGARVSGDKVRIPAALVMDQVARCPRQVQICGRNGLFKTLGDGSLNWHNLGGARDVYDHGSRKRRPAMIQDVRDSTRLLDALDEVSSITPFCTPQDVPGQVMSLAMYRHSLPNTTKPLQGPGVQNAREVKYAAQMAAVVGPAQELLSLSVSPVSPLTFPDDAVEAIIAIAQAGVAFGPLPCPTGGMTAPLSIAGALAQQGAEVLASLVLAQLVHPGLPMIYCGRLAMMEPRTGISVWGGVELGLASAGTVQLAHYYGLPVNVYGFSTNSHTLDIQNGFERAMNAVIPALAGADELSGIGEMEAGVMGSYAQMVCDNEIAASVQRLKRGFATDQDAVAVEVVANCMNGSRSFMSQKHTRQYLRAGEILVTHLAERNTFDTWDREGRQSMAERAHSEALRLLNHHHVPPLTEFQEQELDSILEEAT